MQDSIAQSAAAADETMRASVASKAATVTLVLLAPFLVYRMVSEDWLVTAIIVGVMCTVAGVIVFLRRGGSSLLALQVLVAIYSTGVVAASYALGFAGMLWLYPLLVANFYCLPRTSALVANLLIVAAIVPPLADEVFVGLRVLATLGLVFMFGWVFSHQLERQRHQLALMALQDTLTGAGNRRALNSALEQARYARQRYARPAALLLLDLDHFKRINDELGHQAGDRVLTAVADHLTARLRRSDRLFRFGGEEFVVLLPETREADALDLAEALRRGCTELEVPGVAQLTFSVGVAELAAEESVDAWLQRADEALYRAKAGGRDRVATAKRDGA